MEEYPMTEAGLTELKTELANLKEVKQVELNQKIKAGRGFCDFSEDVSFREMLDNRTDLEARIKTLENTLRHAVLIETGESTSTVVLGSTVTFIELTEETVETYTIVGELEADPAEQKISDESPLGSHLLGTRVNDEVNVPTPGGNMSVKILSIG